MMKNWWYGSRMPRGILLILVWEVVATHSVGAGLPELVVPDGLGTNIHFRGAPKKDLDMLHAAGFRFVRMDFTWSLIEKQKGIYNFGPYDQLTDGLQDRGIRVLYILDYSNALYESSQSVRTEAGRATFTRFAETAAKRYRGRGIVWELWNEPNIGFWKPQPSLNDYMALAKRVFPAIRRADPTAVCVAPATSGIPLDFLEGCFRQGLLDLVDAVSVHPYRSSPPETVAEDLRRLRALIAKYRPDRPDFPVISGEWGYSCARNDFSEELQGEYLPRQFLTNLSLGIPISIWYDWHDDGPDPKEPEHHFGTVTLDYRPKPAYLAMQRLVSALRGMRFVKRMESAEQDYLLLFSDGRRYELAVWTTGEPHMVQILPGKSTHLTHAPQYLDVPASAENILAEASWTVEPRSVGVHAGARPGDPLIPAFVVRLHNRLPRRVPVRLSAQCPPGVEGEFVTSPGFELNPGETRTVSWQGTCRQRDTETFAVTVRADVAGHARRQVVHFVVINPLRIGFATARQGVMVMLYHSRDERLTGILEAHVGRRKRHFAVLIAPEPRQVQVRALDETAQSGLPYVEPEVLGVPLPLQWHGEEDVLSAQILQDDQVCAQSPTVRLTPLSVTIDTARALNDGDPKVPAKFALEPAHYPHSTLQPDGLKLKYSYGKGWKFVRIAPVAPLPVEGKPESIGVWVRGDGSNNKLRMRFVDQNGRTFQPDFGRLDFRGWKFLTASMNNPHVGHWGGQGDASTIAYPIRIDTFILVDSNREPVQGEVEFAGFCLQTKTP